MKKMNREKSRTGLEIAVIGMAGLRYTPRGKIHTPVYFFAARQSEAIQKERWDDYCHKPITYYEVSGSHYTLLKRPEVLEFSRLFQEVMAQAI
jgi:thioesterase domain-containing protein